MPKTTRLSLLQLILLSFCFVSLALPPRPAAAQDESSLVLVLTYDGPVTPTMVEYFQRGIRMGEERQAELVIIQLNTPGGSVALMNQIVQDIRASQVPVLVYVYPRGGMAASAGAIITIAGHVSAMAPETIIGAASPIDASGSDLNETAAAKEKNALIATVETLMTNRSPEAVQLARDMIDTARAVSANEALNIGLVDYVAGSLEDVLRQVDGKTVVMDGQEVTINTAFARVETLDQSFIEQILRLLTNPNIVFLLITIGVQAILIELSSPGGWLAGFIGVVCLALATYGLGILPVNWFGIVFLITAFVLFILEVKTPTSGALTVFGTASLVVGALVLFNSPGTPDFQRVSVPLVGVVSLATALGFVAIITFAVRAQKIPVLMGQASLVGKTGLVRADLNPRGTVLINGELWTAELAEGTGPVASGAEVEIVQARGVRLLVKPLHKPDSN